MPFGLQGFNYDVLIIFLKGVAQLSETFSFVHKGVLIITKSGGLYCLFTFAH